MCSIDEHTNSVTAKGNIAHIYVAKLNPNHSTCTYMYPYTSCTISCIVAHILTLVVWHDFATGKTHLVTFTTPSSVTSTTVSSTTPSSVTSTTPSSVTSTAPSSVTSTAPSSVTSTTPSSVTSTSPSSVTSITPSSVTSTTPSFVTSTTPSSVTSTTTSSVTSTIPSSVTSSQPSATAADEHSNQCPLGNNVVMLHLHLTIQCTCRNPVVPETACATLC